MRQPLSLRRAALVFLVGICLVCAACGAGQTVPTAASMEVALTEQFVTENAPPPGFDRGVQFPDIDRNLTDLPHWHYVVLLTFEGVFAGTQQAAKGQISAEVFSNEVSGERHVILEVTGEMFGAANGSRRLEGVRIGTDYYLVDQNGSCAKTTEKAGQDVSELKASRLIGGVKNAFHTYVHRPIIDLPSWQYAFAPDDVIPPTMQKGDGGTITVASGDLWVAPSYKAVVQYAITLNVVNITLQGSRAVSGQIHVQYNLLDVNQQNISIPYGC